MKPLHLLGLAVLVVVCAAAVIDCTMRAMFGNLDGIYINDDNW
jgi:hypothetical protein